MITIEVLIQTLPILAGEPFNITRLNGWSNHTYLLKRDDEAYVVRIPPEQSIPCIDRVNESKHVKDIKALGITPATVYDDPASGVAIRQFVPGQVVSDDPTRITPEQLAGMASVLKKLHNSDCKLAALSLFGFLTNDLDYVKQHFTLDLRYAELEAYAKRIAAKWPNAPTAPCHMDPNPHNFLCANDNNIWLLDFEFAGQCDPAWDLAYTITYCMFSKTQEALFLEQYAPDQQMRERIQDYKALTQLIQAIWIRQQFTVDHYPVDKDEMLRWEDRALERAMALRSQ